MGKHSAPESPGFWRAVIIAGLRYLVVLALLGAVGFGIYKLAFEGDDAEPASEEDITALPEDPFAGETPTASPTASGEPSPSGSPSRSASPGGRTQVLDASGSPARLDSAAQKLESAGYEVIAKGTTTTALDKTTVFYHPGNQEMAEAVADLLEVALVQPVGTRRLDPSIPVAVIIGPDYAG